MFVLHLPPTRLFLAMMRTKTTPLQYFIITLGNMCVGFLVIHGRYTLQHKPQTRRLIDRNSLQSSLDSDTSENSGRSPSGSISRRQQSFSFDSFDSLDDGASVVRFTRFAPLMEPDAYLTSTNSLPGKRTFASIPSTLEKNYLRSQVALHIRL